MSKSLIFLVKSFLGNFYRHLAIFFWSHWSTRFKKFWIINFKNIVVDVIKKFLTRVVTLPFNLFSDCLVHSRLPLAILKGINLELIFQQGIHFVKPFGHVQNGVA